LNIHHAVIFLCCFRPATEFADARLEARPAGALCRAIILVAVLFCGIAQKIVIKDLMVSIDQRFDFSATVSRPYLLQFIGISRALFR